MSMPDKEIERWNDKNQTARIIGIVCFCLTWLIFFNACSSNFFFSWKKEKKVEAQPPVKAEKKESAAPKTKPLPPSFVDSLNPPNKNPSRHEEKPSFDGIQITRLKQRSVDGLSNFLNFLKKNGIHAIYFRVFQNPGDAYFHILPIKAKTGVYFKTSYAPLVSDLLPVVCRLAHQQDIQVYAWMETLNASFIRCKKAKHIHRYDPSRKSIKSTRRLTPFDREVARCLCGLFSDLAKNAIDGVLIQDDLILHYNEDFSPVAIRSFKRDARLKRFLPAALYRFRKAEKGGMAFEEYTPLFWEWCRWKNRRLSGLLRKLMVSIKKSRPSAKVAVDINYEALSSPKNALAWYSRTIHVMEKIAHPDIYAVMAYQKQMQRELGLSEDAVYGKLGEMVVAAMRFVPNPERWAFKIQTIDWKTRKPLNSRQVTDALKSVRKAGPVQIFLMPFNPNLLNKERLARIQTSKK